MFGENGPETRKRICKYLNFAGVELDLEKNDIKGIQKEISTADSKVKLWIITTNEEIMIARDAQKIIKDMEKLMIEFDFSRSKLREQSIIEYRNDIIKYDKKLEKEAKKNDKMVGWMLLPENYDKEELQRILKAKEKIRKESDVLIVIGIGGSYLGAKAVIDALIKEKSKKDTEVIFVGNNMSTRYINDIISYIYDKDFSINVISKSGTTTEPAIAFRIFKQLLIEKYGIEEARTRIYVTTDKLKGALREIAIEEAYETFSIPDNIGGRYSVLTAVGLLPIAVSRIRYYKIIRRCKKCNE